MPLSESGTEPGSGTAHSPAEPRPGAGGRAGPDRPTSERLASDRAATGEPEEQSPESVDEDGIGHHRPAGEQAEPEAEAKAEAEAEAERNTFAQAYLTFNAPVYAPGSGFGSAWAVPGAGRRRATGRLDDQDVRAALDFYVRPAQYATALEALLENHVLVLEGQEGTGRRAAAIALLREVTDSHIVMLPPVLTLQDHAERDYERGYAYLTIDHIRELRAHGEDVVWRAVRDRIRDAGAYLVITAEERTATRTEAVRHVRWSRPSLSAVLRAHLPDLPEIDLAQLVEVIPPEWTTASVADVGRRIRAGEGIECAFDVFDSTAASQVGAWFDRGRTQREIVEVTALCFTVGQSRRSFERLVERLDSQLTRRLAPPEDAGPRNLPAGGLPEIRAAFSDPGGLIAVQAQESGEIARYAVAFRSAGYRRRVVEELSRRHDSRFWDAVRSWLEEVLDDCDPREVAAGLAHLARTDTDEVEHEYLERWAAGVIGPKGQLTASFTLWVMCFGDALSRFALRRAIRWTNEPDGERRHTALLAFSGELGLRYPTEAVRRFWQLITQDPRLSTQAQAGLANLFAALTHAEEDATVVLRTLGRHLDRFTRRGVDVRLTDLTMDTTLTVLSYRDPVDGRPAISSYLSSRPDQASLAARLWGGVIRHHGYRRRGMEALTAALAALDNIDAGTDIAAGLGSALQRDLTAAELLTFRADLVGLVGDARDARTRFVRILVGTDIV